MKRRSYSITLAIVTVALILSAAVLSKAQNREKFVISAKAGGVNAISGRTEVRSKHGGEWQLLSITDDLKTGDVVKTGADGRLEMLLNPGSYLRVGENSEFELKNDSLDDLEVRLNQGTAIVEATGANGIELQIILSTPQARMAIVTSGLYRVNVLPGDATELIVRKGRVLLDNSQTKVKAGNKVIFTGNTYSVAKLGKADKEKDNLESWSKQRAETLALANRRIPGREANLFLAGLNDPWSYQFSARSAGVWFFNPAFRCFTFLPFYFGWGSPYGSAYSGIWYYGGYHCCGWNPYYGPVAGGSNGSFSGSGSGSRSGGGSGTGSSGSGGGLGSGGGSGSGSGGRISPQSSPNPAPPVRESSNEMPARRSEQPVRPLPPR